MSSANPPYPWFNGIQYNPSFFASSSTGDLTKAQANALYLRKTVPDTATAIETFNAGILTDTINAITGTINSTSNINFNNSSSSIYSDNLYLNGVVQTEVVSPLILLNNSAPFVNQIALGDSTNTFSITSASVINDQTTSNSHTITSPFFTINNAAAPNNDINIGNVTTTNTLDILAKDLYLQGENSVSIYSGVTPLATVTISGVGMSIGDGDTNTLSLTSITYSNTSETTTIESSISHTTESPILNLNTTNLLGGTNVVNIGNTTATTSVDVKATALKLNSTKTSTNTVAIGNSTYTSTITINRPLTIGYTILPISGQLGYTFTPTSTQVDTFPLATSASFVFANTVKSIAATVVPAGVWLINANQLINCVTVGTSPLTKQVQLQIRKNGGAPIANQSNERSYTTFSGLQQCLNVSAVVTCNGTTDVFSLTYALQYSGNGTQYGFAGNQFQFAFTRLG